tara:strand:- start:418 stop:573 length:156 start_codon:yes stop_codon:yes gene_type:complete
MEHKITKILVNKLLKFPEDKRMKIAILLIGSSLMDFNSEDIDDLTKALNER